MGSLVMTHVAPTLAQHTQRSMMVGGSQQTETSDIVSRSSCDRSTSVSSNAGPTDIPATPQSPTLRPRNTQPIPSSTSQSRPSIREPAGSQASTASQSQPATHSSHNLNQHARGFDQSGFPLGEHHDFQHSSPSSPRLQPTYRSTRSLGGSEATSPSRIKVKNLSHIQSFASEEFLARPYLTRPDTGFGDPQRQYEISAMPVTDIIEMVAGLLTKITTTNDQQHEHVHRPIPSQEEQSNMSLQASCVLAFHGKNVPSITILSYLSRIHKYCPTTYEVFLSLLVYFDRMTEQVNKLFAQDAQRLRASRPPSSQGSEPSSPMAMNVDSLESVRTPPPLGTEPLQNETSNGATLSGQDLSQFFVVDSFNIHRLVIAAVTCASKFFSDVFYTNSRYAKVGGLPLAELNHLELQFLLLNDFRLSVPVEELEAYGTRLVEFYAREIVAQQQGLQGHPAQTNSGGLYMRDARAPTQQIATPP